jgi:hypothetical protein
MKTLAFVIGLLWSASAFADQISQQVLVDPKTQPMNEWASIVWAKDKSGWITEFPTNDSVRVTLDSGSAKPREPWKRVSYFLKYLPSPPIKPWLNGSLYFDFDAAVASYVASGRAVAYLNVVLSVRATRTKDRFWVSVGLFDPRTKRVVPDQTACVPSHSTGSPVVATRAERGRSFIELANDSDSFSQTTWSDLRPYRIVITRENVRAMLTELKSMNAWCAKHHDISTEPADYEVAQISVMLESFTDKDRTPDARVKVAITLANPNFRISGPRSEERR